MSFLNAYNTQIGNFQVTIDLTNYANGLPRINFGTITAATKLSATQFGHINFLVTSDFADPKISGGKLVWKFKGLSQVNDIKFDLNYNNPEGDLRTVASFYQIPDAPLALVYLEAKKQKGNKKWLKSIIAWLAKNWDKLAGAVMAVGTVSEVIVNAGNKNSDTPDIPDIEDPEKGDIDPTTGKPYGELTNPTILDQIGDFVKENALPIAGVGLLAFILYPGKKKTKKRRR